MFDTKINSLIFKPESREPKDGTYDDNEICQWDRVTLRPPTSFDFDASLIFEFLYNESSKFYMSCGAKFGSDFLIYDGPREERHAFAGMRILSANKGLPIPTSYAMAGYVRCLNKAGKLALMATVLHEEVDGVPLHKILLVDVALEKILSAETHRKRARTEVRRDITLNLTKNK